MAAASSSAQISRFNLFPSQKLNIPFSSSSFSPSFKSLPFPSFSFSLSLPTTSTNPPSFSHRRCYRVRASIRKLSESEPVSIPKAPEELGKSIPDTAGVYAVYDAKGELQYVGISRNIAASVEKHRKNVPSEMCSSVKVGPADTPMPDRTDLQSAWKSWIEDHIAATGIPPPGNLPGNHTWVGTPADLRLTPGRHVTLTVPLEQLIDRLVKEHKVVAFIKGSRRAPQCGFSQKVVGILEANGVDFVSVDVLDEEHNFGLREELKRYSNWPTFPQVFAGGELVGGCDIIVDLAEKGELKTALQI